MAAHLIRIVELLAGRRAEGLLAELRLLGGGWERRGRRLRQVERGAHLRRCLRAADLCRRVLALAPQPVKDSHLHYLCEYGELPPRRVSARGGPVDAVLAGLAACAHK